MIAAFANATTDGVIDGTSVCTVASRMASKVEISSRLRIQ
jgi:hypothetical protein